MDEIELENGKRGTATGASWRFFRPQSQPCGQLRSTQYAVRSSLWEYPTQQLFVFVFLGGSFGLVWFLFVGLGWVGFVFVC